MMAETLFTPTSGASSSIVGNTSPTDIVPTILTNGTGVNLSVGVINKLSPFGRVDSSNSMDSFSTMAHPYNLELSTPHIMPLVNGAGE